MTRKGYMRGTAKECVLALSAAILLTLVLAACHQSYDADGSGSTNLKIVGLIQIDKNANCPPTSIAMMGPLSGPDAALGTNITDGAQLAIDKHNPATVGCHV